MTRTYRSKVDGWLGLVLAGMPLLILWVAWQLVRVPIPGKWMLGGVLVLTGVVLPLSLLFATTYTLTDTVLRIRSGFFRWNIPLRDITGVERTQDPISSPALSLDRLRIHHGAGKVVLISPKNPEGFLQDLQALGVPRN